MFDFLLCWPMENFLFKFYLSNIDNTTKNPSEKHFTTNVSIEGAITPLTSVCFFYLNLVKVCFFVLLDSVVPKLILFALSEV